jgi:hypothetical protein
VVIQVAAARPSGSVVSDHLDIVNNTVAVPVQELAGPVGARQHLLHVQPGTVSVGYDATVSAGAGASPAVTDEPRVEACVRATVARLPGRAGR